MAERQTIPGFEDAEGGEALWRREPSAARG